MAKGAADLSGPDLVYGYMSEYLDGELRPEIGAKFADLLKGEGASLPEKFQTVRGQLQLALQSFYLKEGELVELRALVQDPSITATIENVRIEELGRGEVVSTLLRRLALVAIAAAIIGGLVWKFSRNQEQAFKPLEYLGYEALAMEEDPHERLNLPTGDLREIRQYLGTYPGLDFKPKVMKVLAANWQPDGATVIDYEIAKVAVVQYSNTSSKEKLFHFSYAGELSDLPRAEPGNMNGFVFQTYASDELNLIAWQSAPGVVSLLVGRRSAPELAELAIAGTAKD